MLNIRDLPTFGDIAAEDDETLLSYFLTTPAVSRIEQGDAIVVLGRKGSGKTALVRHFTEKAESDRASALNLRDYPWTIHARLIDRGASAVEAYTASWRLLIAVKLASIAVALGGNQYTDTLRDLRRFLQDNYGGTSPRLSDILQPQALRFTQATLAPSVFGNQLGSLVLNRNTKSQFGLEANAVAGCLLDATTIAFRELRKNTVFLHFDELDHGLDSVDGERRKLLIGLMLAVRQTSRDYRRPDFRVCPVVYLRTDIWEQLQFSDKNKITQSSSVHLNWTSDELQKMIDVRLSRTFGDGATWDDVDDGQRMRGSQAKWDHVLARTFMRPRDVIQFLNSALEQAKKSSDPSASGTFSNHDITESREAYSPYLKAELDDEITPHWPQWAEALAACSSIETLTFQRDQFVPRYDEQRSRRNGVDAEEALRLLYRFSVIGCEKRSGYGGQSWTYRYQNPDASFDQAASRYKVHLGLKEYAKLKEERDAA